MSTIISEALTHSAHIAISLRLTALPIASPHSEFVFVFFDFAAISSVSAMQMEFARFFIILRHSLQQLRGEPCHAMHAT
jgi:hypothetical protein